MDPSSRIYARVSRGLLWTFVAICLWVGTPTSSRAADDQIWSALVLARNVPDPREPVRELKPYSGKIKKFFGYNQIELVGAATKTVSGDCERWLVPSQNFWMSVDAKQAPASSYLLKIALYHDKRCLVTARVRLVPDSPLIIRGPLHARGQLLIVLQVL